MLSNWVWVKQFQGLGVGGAGVSGEVLAVLELVEALAVLELVEVWEGLCNQQSCQANSHW